MKIRATINFEAIERAYRSGKSGILLEGGSRSGKTWSVIQWLLLYCKQNQDKVVTVGRDWASIWRKTAWLDVVKITNQIAPDAEIQKGPMNIAINKNLLRSVGLNDDIMITHGLSQDVFWVNEAMSVSRDTFDNLEQRTSAFWICDYNPTSTESWLYDVANRPDVAFLKTTVLDNPFAPERARRKIMSYEPTEQNKINGTANPHFWKVYGLGERAADEEIIFQNWQYFADWPSGYDWKLYGGDFGYADSPSTCVEVRKVGHSLYVKEVFYGHAMSNKEIAHAMKEYGAIDVQAIFDSTEEKSIKELKSLNIIAIKATKGPDSVRHGINKLKQYRIFVHVDSSNLADELKNYKWAKKRSGEYYRDAKGYKKALKENDHCIDSFRYAVTKFSRWA